MVMVHRSVTFLFPHIVRQMLDNNKLLDSTGQEVISEIEFSIL